MDDFDLNRFVRAQDFGRTYDQALAELRDGRKRTHWMWFIFPQIAGLGRSSTAAEFAISSLDEARAYLGHPVLGPRLLECCSAVLSADGGRAEAIFGGIDAIKLRSSMTLFLRAAPDQPAFADVLEAFFAGQPDPATDNLLAAQQTSQ